MRAKTVQTHRPSGITFNWLQIIQVLDHTVKALDFHCIKTSVLPFDSAPENDFISNEHGFQDS